MVLVSSLDERRKFFNSRRASVPFCSVALAVLALALCLLGVSGCSGGWGEFKPTLTAQLTNKTVKVGDTVNFTVATTGTGPITYQWFRNDAPIGGAVNVSYSFVAQAADNGVVYSVRATNAGGTAMSAGTLTVLVPPVITVQPQNRTIAAVQTATFTVVATGTAPLSYQWYENGKAIGVGTATYTTPSMSVASSGTSVAVTVSNAAGSASSSLAVLTVTPILPTLVFVPIPAETFGTSQFAVSAGSASGGTITYRVASGPATVSGNTVSLTGAGTVVLSASQAASGNYGPANATTTFTVQGGTPTLHFTVSDRAFTSVPFPVSAVSSIPEDPGALTYSLVSGPATVTSGGLVTLTSAGTVVVAAMQAADAGYSQASAQTSFNISLETPTLAFTVPNQTYGTGPFAVSASSSASADPGTISYSVVSGPATVSASGLVTLTGTGTVVLSANQAAANGYGATSTHAIFNVNAASPTLSFSVADQTYNTAPFTVAAMSSMPADAGAIIYAVLSGPATVTPAGSVSLTGVGSVVMSATQAESNGYNSASTQAGFTVTPAKPALTFSIPDQTFNTTPFMVSAIAGTTADTTAVTYALVSGPAIVTPSGSVTMMGAGTVVVAAAQAANSDYSSATAQASFTISPATPILSLSISNQTYGTVPFTIGATSSLAGDPGAVTYALVSGPATVTAAGVVTVSGTGTVLVSATQAASPGYASATAQSTFTVAAQTPTLTFSVANQTYSTSPITVAATSNVSADPAPITYALVSGPATVSPSGSVTFSGAGTVVIAATQGASGPYNSASAQTSFTVSSSMPTLALAVANQTYSPTPFVVAATSSISADPGAITYALVSGPATVSSAGNVNLTGSGTVLLVATQAASAGYSSATVQTSFNVNTATPALSFSVGNQTYSPIAFAVSATSSLTADPAGVTYALVSGPASVIASGIVTLTGTGPVVISATQAAIGGYASATTQATFTVTAATPTLTFNVAGQTYSPTAFAVSAISSLIADPGGITYALVSGPATVTSSGTVTLTGAGSVVIAATQAATGGYGSATTQATFAVVAATPTLTFPGQTLTYSPTPLSATATSSLRADPGAITYALVSGPATVTPSGTVSPSGAGTVVISATQAATGGYGSATTQANFTITPAAPTLTLASIANQLYGATVSASATSTSPATILYSLGTGSPATISGSAITTNGVGTVTVIASQSASANYTAASVSTTFSVGQATATLTLATIGSQTYGAIVTASATSPSPGTITYSLGAGSPATITGNSITTTGVGAVTVIASQAATADYATPANAQTTFSVGQATPTLSLAPIQNQTYGGPALTITATSSSTGAITYTLGSGSPATIAGNTITTNGVGTVTVTVTQAATSDYTAPASASLSFNVVQAKPTLAIASIPEQTSGQVVSANATSASSGAITYTMTTTTAATISSAGLITTNGAGTITVTANQAATANYLAPANVSTSFNVVAAGYPVITTQPVSQTVCLNAPLSLSVVATSTAPLSYQWYLGANAISGGTGSSYNLGAALASEGGNYTVVVTNSTGGVTSSVASVVVGATITSNPANLSVSAGQTATFAVAVAGDSPFTYQWYSMSSGASSGTAISSATSSSYTTAATTTAMTGDKFYVIVTDLCGTAQKSSNATLTVATSNVPPTITAQPESQNVAAGSTPTFSVTATGSGTLAYQWYDIPAGQKTGTAISGATASSYTLPYTSTTTTNDQDKYYVVVSNSYGQSVSLNATLSVGAGIQITQQPQTAYVVAGNAATFSVTASSTVPLTYQWYQALPGSSTFTAISNATSSTYTIASPTASQSASVFYVIVSNGGATSAVTSSSVGLFVGALANIPVCSTGWNTGGTAVPLTTANTQTNNTCGYQLTAATTAQSGDMVWPTLIAADNLQLSFTVTTANGSTPPADGFAVVLGDPSLGARLNSTGATGQGLGAKGIPGLVLAFDDFYNSGDPAVPYVGVTRGENALWETPYTLDDTGIPALAITGEIVTHSYVVTLVNGQMTVSMDGLQILSGAVNAPPVAYLYVTSSTGGSYEQTQVTNISASVSAP